MTEIVDNFPHFPASRRLTMAIYEGLKESYPSITPDFIEKSIERVRCTPKSEDKDVIDMFVRANLKKGEDAYSEREERRAARAGE